MLILKRPDEAKLRELLDYNPITGVFTWKIDRTGTALSGTEAGTVDFRGYRVISIMGKDYKAHILGWFLYYGEWPNANIDHINGIKLNNWIDNLRVSVLSGNHFNTPKRADNKSGYKGVYF